MTDPATLVWERRFLAPLVSFPEWTDAAPDRLVYTSNESGVWQATTLELATGVRRRVTDHPVGVTAATITRDGRDVAWWQDETGDESGRWLAQPFEGGPTRPLVEDVPVGWSGGLSMAGGASAMVVSGRDGFALYLAEGRGARRLHHSEESFNLGGAWFGAVAAGGLSPDGALVCIEHTEHGDLIHPALGVLDARTGDTVAELRDEGLALHASCWDPTNGHRMAIVHERDGENRPGIWDVATGEVRTLELDVPGGVEPLDWAENGSLLVTGLHEGRTRLFRLNPSTGEATEVGTEPGMVFDGRFRPDGSIWYLHHQAHRGPQVLDEDGLEAVRPEGDRPPAGRPYESWHFVNPHGQRVHGFVVTPDGPGPRGGPPYPVMMFVHGGPTSADTDRWQPEVQAYVDAGFLVGLVNYRGSTGYGRAWRDTLMGDIGGPELEDVNAGLADLVARGLADPARAVVAGWSWGGYVTLLELGKHPELWTCGVAGIPVADYEAGYEDLSPLLQAYDRALLGGTPKEKPELMRDRNPINFADRVTAPVLFVIGLHDSRCPPGQAFAYVDRLKARGHPHEVITFGTGHGSFDADERVRQVRAILEFLERNVPAG
jgi:dipeptidyl aminopeptidase/acylaminoacyl peptidase